MKNQMSNASLASAAASAAIRSRPTTPTSVADVQTKRMLRRAGSTSSVGSSTLGSVRGPPGSTLERRGSAGSMSERTFRDPSPQPSPHVPSAEDAPPVPALPKKIPLSNSHRRAASLETHPPRVASPPPNMANGRGSSLGPMPYTTLPRRTGKVNNPFTDPGTSSQRSINRGSVNYSLPTSRRAESPISQRQLTYLSSHSAQQPRITSPTNQDLVYDANTRSFLPYAQVLAIEQKVQDAAQQPVKKKKRIAPAQSTGTHLAEGTMGRPHGTAVDAIESQHGHIDHFELPQSDRSIETATPKVSTPTKKKKNVVNVTYSDNPNSSDNDSDFRGYNTRAGAMLVKKPSIVREDREQEEEQDNLPRQKNVPEVTPRPDMGDGVSSSSPTLPRSSASRAHNKGTFVQADTPVTTIQPSVRASELPSARAVSQPIMGSVEPLSNQQGLAATSDVRGGRVSSVSPVRVAHFAITPDNLAVKHQPLGRSVSPRKSAMKNSGLERGSSPAGSDVDFQNGSVVGSDDSPMLRKKANRVSFDETNVIVGEAAGVFPTDSPIAPSPQSAKSRNWFSLGGRKKKEDSVLQDEDDEIMKPRPALPSFGSVRGRNIREPVEERPLVKPVEQSTPTPKVAAPAPVIKAALETAELPLGQSNDHAVGALISQDAALKNEANTSRSREPLPPQVQSVEGSGYHSDSDSTISVLDDTYKDAKKDYSPASSMAASTEAVQEQNAPINGNGSTASTSKLENIPEISFTEPTPTIDNREWLSMPGGFPDTGSDSGLDSIDNAPEITEQHVTDLTPALVGIAEPYEGPLSGSPVVGEVHNVLEHSILHHTIPEETDDSDTTSIYSDAAEDLSDLEDGDGFQSLNAVVESPIASVPAVGLPILTPTVSPVSKNVPPQVNSQALGTVIGPPADAGWGKAQEYWSGLSAEKKRQLEREAQVEEGDSDSTIEAKPKPTPKAKTRKKVTVAAAPPLNRPQSVNYERTYMIQPGTKVDKDGYTSTMKSSMRAEPPSPAPDTHMRKSMRSQGSMQGSLRGSEKVESRASQRPVSLPASPIKSDPTAVGMYIKAYTAASAGKQPALRRRGSGDSDSSFKRTRPAEVTTFRRSMRNSSVQASNNRQQSPMGSGRFSLRSKSPTDPRGAPPVSMGTQFRSSMRQSQDTPSLRGTKSDRGKSPIRIPGFGRSQNSKQTKQRPMSIQSSRFEDSSDDDEPRNAFQSRFVDSSDEEEVPPLPKKSGMRGSMRASQPVRSIPQRVIVNDGDSSDLPDSDDEKNTPPPQDLKVAKTRPNMNIGTSSIRRSGSGRGAMSPSVLTTNISGPSRPTHSRRGSFMSNILRRKKDDPSSKVRKSDAESPARRDTPLERSRSDLAAVKRQESYNTTNGGISNRPVHSPKLQKRSNSGNWPLSPPPLFGDEKEGNERPFTADAADGIVGGEKIRPDLGNRRSTATGAGVIDAEGAVGATPPRKKKKFQALRKMFRLDD